MFIMETRSCVFVFLAIFEGGGGGGGLITDWSVFIMNLDQAPLGATHSGSKIAFFGSL